MDHAFWYLTLIYYYLGDMLQNVEGGEFLFLLKSVLQVFAETDFKKKDFLQKIWGI